mgnify:CR=1 FL=1
MSDDLLTTLRFEVDGSGVATGLTSVKRSITDLGNAVKDITDKTNAALGKVGTEELPVAKGLEKASKSIIKQTGDIEKAIATFGSTASTSLKQAYKDINAEEVRLRGMGIDAAIMNPYLEKLREVQKLTAAVAAQERTLAQGAAQAVEAENQRLAHTLELKRQIASVKTTVDNNNAAAQAAKQAEIEAQQKFKLLGLNNQIQAAQKAAADAQAAQSAKALKDFKDLAAAQAAFAQEVMNSELNFKHTGRGKSTEYLAEKARELGIDKQFADQKLANYRQIESASKAAFQAANPHLAEMAKRAEAAGTSVKGLSASMRNVPAQFTDIIVSLQGGQAPLTVLLQQGGQLKDMFGGVGNAARALGGYVLDLINPFTATAAAVAAIGYAAYQASEDAKALNKSLILSNGASGTTIGELTKVAESITATSIGAGKASEALAEFITAGVKAGDSLGEFTKTAIELERVGGASIKETAKAFADLGKDPLSNLNVLTLATYRQVEALLEQGDKIGAVKVAQAALNQENERVTAGLRAQEGVLDTSTRYWKDLGVSVWDTVRGLSQAVLLTPKTGNEERQELQKRRDTYAAQGYDTTKEDARLAYFKRLDDAQKESVKNQTKEIELKTILANLDAKDEGTRKLRERNQLIADNTRLLEAGLISQKRYDDVLANFDKQKAPAKTAKAVESEYDKLIKKLGSELPKAAAEAEAAQNGYNKAQTEFIALVGGDSWGKFTNDQRATVAALYERKIASEQSEAATKALAKAEQEATKAHEDYLKKLGGDGAKEVASLEARVQKQAQHNAEIGKTAEQIEAVRRVSEEAATKELEAQALAITALLEKNEALLDYGDSQSLLSGQAKEIYEIEVKSLREQIKLRKQLAKGYTEGETLEAAATAAKATTAEWKRGWEETDRLARDVFTTWATDGSNAAQKIGDTLKKALLSAIYEATIKPIALQLYTSIAGGGGAAGAVQAASGAGNVSSLLGSAGSAFGAFGSGAASAASAVWGGAGVSISNAVSSGIELALEGSFAQGAGMISGALGPVVLGLAALKSAMDYKVEATGNALVANLGGGSTVVANRNDYTQTGGLFGGGTTQNSEWSAASAELTAYMDAQVKLVTESARAYGTALGLPVADLDSFKQQIEVSMTGLNADQATKAINEAIAGFGNAMASANFGPTLDAFKQKGEASGDTLKRLATEITTVNGTLGMLGGKLLSVDAAGIKAADGLVQAMGGLEAFQSATASYYESYYSAEEKRLNTAKNIQTQLANAGVEVTLEQVLNGTKEQFRALVESFTTDSGNLDEAGQKAVAALMAVAGAFAGIATASASAASAVTVPTESSFGSGVGSSSASQSGWSGPTQEAANAIIDERKSLQDQLDELTMTNTQLLEKQRNAIDESNRALWDQVQAAKAAAAAAEERKSLQEQYNQLTMTETQLRELERETIAESNRELFDRITAIKAEQAAIAEANTAVDNAFAAVQRAIDAEKKSIEASRQAAQERVNIIKTIVDSVTGAIDTLRGNVGSTKAQAAREANAFIDNALATAKATGYLPDPDDLKDAISKATGGIDREGLSQFEYEKQNLILAGKLEGLKAVASPQLSAAKEAVKLAEAQLKALDDQLAAAQESINVLRGIDTSVKTVEAALAALAVALGVAESAGVGGSGGAVTINPGDYQANGTSTGALEYIGESTGGLSNDFWRYWSTHMQNVYGEDAGYKVYNMAIERGVSSTQLEEILGMSAGQANAWALAHGLASFDVGTDYVPKTGLALIHEGERITPRAFNPAAGGSSGNARLESLVEGLTKEVQRLQSIVNEGNRSNERIATAVHGSPDRPQPVEVMPA